jgi:hydroxymethylpyrimidine pyrophosphatase-like HAD family hydrolase
MTPLAGFPLAARRAVRGVLADIDDTLTTHGRLHAVAYSALERLREAGLLVIPVTGRPAGWCDHIARMWPVDVVGEPERQRRAQRMDAIAARILAEVPGCGIASDQPYREADLAIDFCEDVPRLGREEVARIVAIMQSEGLTAKVSSIHVNGWFGGYDKLSTTRLALAEDFGVDLDRDKEGFVFAGDSPNDQPMFAFFPNAVGVANVRDMADLMTSLPRYVTPSAGSAGFAELARALLEAR